MCVCVCVCGVQWRDGGERESDGKTGGEREKRGREKGAKQLSLHSDSFGAGSVNSQCTRDKRVPCLISSRVSLSLSLSLPCHQTHVPLVCEQSFFFLVPIPSFMMLHQVMRHHYVTIFPAYQVPSPFPYHAISAKERRQNFSLMSHFHQIGSGEEEKSCLIKCKIKLT